MSTIDDILDNLYKNKYSDGIEGILDFLFKKKSNNSSNAANKNIINVPNEIQDQHYKKHKDVSKRLYNDLVKELRKTALGRELEEVIELSFNDVSFERNQFNDREVTFTSYMIDFDLDSLYQFDDNKENQMTSLFNNIVNNLFNKYNKDGILFEMIDEYRNCIYCYTKYEPNN